MIDVKIRLHHMMLLTDKSVRWWRRADWTGVKWINPGGHIELEKLYEPVFIGRMERAGLAVDHDCMTTCEKP
jgi:hypothetical protein